MGPTFRVDETGIRTPGDWSGTIDVEFFGRRVWTFNPQQHGRAEHDGERLVSWPRALRQYLDGYAEVILRDTDSGTSRLVTTVQFGRGQGRVRIVDRHGRPLTVNKRGHLFVMFGDCDQAYRDAIVASLERLTSFLNESGYPTFVAYGSLLGAARDGSLIPHDSDADVCSLTQATHPADIVRESMAVERTCQHSGWQTWRMSGADFKVWAPIDAGDSVGIDVFSAFRLQPHGHVYMMPNVRTDLSLDDLRPTGRVVLEGVTLPAPANIEGVLRSAYGTGWPTPDAGWKPTPPREVMRVLNGNFRGMRDRMGKWVRHYSSLQTGATEESTSFARWVGEQEPTPQSMVELGCGDGAVSRILARDGHRTVGGDYALAAVRYARTATQSRDSTAHFRRVNLCDLRSTLASAAVIAGDPRPSVALAKDVVASIDKSARDNLWRFCRTALSGRRPRIYLQFPTALNGRDWRFPHVVPVSTVVQELSEQGYRATSIQEYEGSNTDAPVQRTCRIIAERES